MLKLFCFVLLLESFVVVGGITVRKLIELVRRDELEFRELLEDGDLMVDIEVLVFDKILMELVEVDFEDDRGVEVDLRVELLDLEDEGRD